ncbi:hypothetical protein [Arabiibacter massiliensis]|uniref:hypothetical protein n=1 Tax=Arabiibacter massiliensis TaxID=1870985 RepID=UPI00155AA07A|nr:hypothetical protein [Arabiibacter massiliensis]
MTEKPLCIPIKVHWTLAVLAGLFDALMIALLAGIALGTHKARIRIERAER